ncbi:chaperonin Cpn10 family protein [Cavenderia fasciculata]|uniref:Chaperonin Cpn10 family protein n=1 Tax=Cavenderia fasciculata TaxID=261658 RepID=F4PTC3_CACFS|nr:chaperonin Cpn10 family protein [Cavenderia fasciculata]EGG21645.1 chaperonin Cpn10 family protein [Cavenderia fasciculata]|eukprot:XP_004359495.1 chaperonin Cpn10 family protein [Cavenderia fasciculata]
MIPLYTNYNANNKQQGIKKFIPLLDRILIEKLSVQSQTAGGIYLPQNKSNENQARVVSVGTGILKSDGSFAGTIVKEGDTIIINANKPLQPILMNDKTYYLMSESDVLGIAELKQ